MHFLEHCQRRKNFHCSFRTWSNIWQLSDVGHSISELYWSKYVYHHRIVIRLYFLVVRDWPNSTASIIICWHSGEGHGPWNSDGKWRMKYWPIEKLETKLRQHKFVLFNFIGFLRHTFQTHPHRILASCTSLPKNINSTFFSRS